MEERGKVISTRDTHTERGIEGGSVQKPNKN